MGRWVVTLCLTVLAAAGCSSRRHDGPGPSDAATRDAAPGDRDSGAPDGDPTPTSRTALNDTLSQNDACQQIKPFYWEIGRSTGPVVSGSAGAGYTRDTELEIASASKWLYASYYVEKKAAQLDDPEEIKFLNFTSGYASINAACLGRSISGCNRFSMNTAPGTTDHPGDDPSAVDRFDYNSGHLEAHAERFAGLGDATAQTLPQAILAQLGDDIALSYVNPLLAGGVRTSSAQYARFLQKILRGDLRMRDRLGSEAVCTLSAEYAELFHENCNAVLSPWWPASSGKLADTPDPSLIQDVHYSIGHWVEADGAFSSPGLFGFYPFIDRDKRWYGLIGRRQIFQVYDEAHPDTSAYALSVRCGQALRAAWLDGDTHP